MALAWTMDKIGPMCRSAEDCGLVLHAIAGSDNNDPSSAGKSFYFAPEFARQLKEVKVGYAPVDFSEWADPATRKPLLDALQAIRDLGVQIQEIKLPDLPYGAVTSTIIAAEGSAAFEDLIASGKIDLLADKRQIAGFKAGLEIPAKDYIKAMRVRRLIQQGLRQVLTDVDLILSPSRFGVAPKVTDPLDRMSARAEQSQEKNPGTRALIPAANLAGFPGLSLPCGFADGMPVAISLVSRPFTENLILSLGLHFQKATDWHRKRPVTG